MAKEKKIRVIQTRGVGGRGKRDRRTLQALGLGRIGKSSELPLNAAVEGMIRSVRHLVDVQEAAAK